MNLTEKHVRWHITGMSLLLCSIFIRLAAGAKAEDDFLAHDQRFLASSPNHLRQEVNETEQLIERLKNAVPGEVITFDQAYVPRYQLETHVDGTWDHPITLRGVGKNALIYGSYYEPTNKTTILKSSGIRILHSNYIFEDFTIQDSKKGLVGRYATNVTVRNVHVVNCEEEAFKVHRQSSFWYIYGSSVTNSGTSGRIGEGFYIGDSRNNWEDSNEFTARYITLENCQTYNTSNDGFDIKEGASYVKFKNCKASWPVGSNGAWGDEEFGNNGYFSRGNDIQYIQSIAANTGKESGMKFASTKVKIDLTPDTYSLTSWGTRVDLKEYKAINMSAFSIVATSSEASEGVVVYKDYTFENVPLGLYDINCKYNCVNESYAEQDASNFVEYVWKGIGGTRVHQYYVTTWVPDTSTSPTASPTSKPLDQERHFALLMMSSLVPFGFCLFFTIIFYLASIQMKDILKYQKVEFDQKPIRQYLEETKVTPHNVDSFFVVPSRGRTIFWYCFGYSILAICLSFASVMYGLPGMEKYDIKHLIPFAVEYRPWKNLHEYSYLEISLIMTSISLTLLYTIPFAYVPIDFEAGKKWKNDPEFLRRIGVIIPCHKSAAEIGEVLRRVLKYIPPENIVVCDNGNFEWPQDDTFEVVKATHPAIKYVFIAQGHKTRALWTGVHRLPLHCDYVVHLDDDTHFNDNMVFDESLFRANTVAVAFIRKSYTSNNCERFVDFWYKITDHFGATQARLCTRCFCPGPAGMWKRSAFLELFGLHPSLPFGEDIFGGFTTLNHGYHIESETRCYVTTFCPPTMLPPILGGIGRQQGYGAASVWKQRAWRWTLSALRITGKSLYSFATYDAGGFWANLAFRLYRFREYKIILVQLMYVPFAIVVIARGFFLEFFLLKLALMLVPLTRNMIINYVIWHGQPELQVTLETVLLSPFYNMFLQACAIHGRWQCLLWYIPTTPPNHGMLQRLRPCDPQAIELSTELLLPSNQELKKRIVQMRYDIGAAEVKRETDGKVPLISSNDEIDNAEAGEAGKLVDKLYSIDEEEEETTFKLLSQKMGDDTKGSYDSAQSNREADGKEKSIRSNFHDVTKDGSRTRSSDESGCSIDKLYTNYEAFRGSADSNSTIDILSIDLQSRSMSLDHDHEKGGVLLRKGQRVQKDKEIKPERLSLSFDSHGETVPMHKGRAEEMLAMEIARFDANDDPGSYMPRRVQYHLYSRWNTFEKCRRDASSVIMPYMTTEEWAEKMRKEKERSIASSMHKASQSVNDKNREGPQLDSVSIYSASTDFNYVVDLEPRDKTFIKVL